jgi:hypothetical protein
VQGSEASALNRTWNVAVLREIEKKFEDSGVSLATAVAVMRNSSRYNLDLCVLRVEGVGLGG